MGNAQDAAKKFDETIGQAIDLAKKQAQNAKNKADALFSKTMAEIDNTVEGKTFNDIEVRVLSVTINFTLFNFEFLKE